MLTVTRGIGEIRTYYRGAERELLRVLLNASSIAETNLALGLLRASVPEKVLLSAINLRDVLSQVPACPFPMAVDMETVVRVAKLKRDRSAWVRSFADAGGDFDIVVLGEGNLCYDLIVHSGDRHLFWSPIPRRDDIIHPDMLDPLLGHETLLRRIIELVQDMGMVFSPPFYLSLDDWLLEYAEDTMDDLGKLF